MVSHIVFLTFVFFEGVVMRVKFKDLYDMYPNKWVLTIEEKWKNGGIETCEVYGVYDTQDEAIEVELANNIVNSGIFKMIKEEDDLGFIFVITNNF